MSWFDVVDVHWRAVYLFVQYQIRPSEPGNGGRNVCSRPDCAVASLHTCRFYQHAILVLVGSLAFLPIRPPSQMADGTFPGGMAMARTLSIAAGTGA